ncbi:MAG: tetratricopeptide repeat protein [Patescibacteria group bacterium]|jgi:tetratricopeptide (TPR) repeat protein
MFDDPRNVQLDPARIDPPGEGGVFEEFCVGLAKVLANDPMAQRNGRNGQSQDGVDVFARYNRGAEHWGFQAKKKDQIKGEKLTEVDIQTEVGKAKNFSPSLQCYFIITTAPRDSAAQGIARSITEAHSKEGLFSVHIWGWEDIREFLLKNKDLLFDYWPQYRPGAQTQSGQSIDEIKKNTEKILESQLSGRPNINNFGSGDVNVVVQATPAIGSGDKSDVLHAKLDVAREQINSGNPQAALISLQQMHKDAWSTADSKLKFRIITNIASAESKVGKDVDAAKHFIEAAQYASQDEQEKAMCNASTGYLLQGNKEKAMEYVDKALKANPASDRAYSLKIYATDNLSIDEIIESIPEAHRNASVVAYAIGFVARQKKDYDTAIKWFRIAVGADPNDKEITTALAETILQTIVENQTFIYGDQLTEDIRQKLKEADQIFNEAWESVSNQDIRAHKTLWLENRSLIQRLFKNYDLAIHLLDEAVEIDKGNPRLVKQKAVLLFEHNKTEEAIHLLKELVKEHQEPEIVIPAAALLRESGDYTEAVNILRNMLISTKDPMAVEEGSGLLLETLMDANRIDEAEILVQEFRQGHPDDSMSYIYAAEVAFAGKKDDIAYNLLEQAKSNITADTLPKDVIHLANLFYGKEKFNDAALLFEKVADQTIDSPLTRRLLNSYYRAGKLGEALDVIKKLKGNHSDKSWRRIADLESSIYEEIGDWIQARKVCTDYLDVHPDDQRMLIRYGTVLLKSGSPTDLAQLDEYLKSEIDVTVLPIDFWAQLIGLYEERGFAEKALAHSYEMRRKFFNLPQAHLQYVGLFFRTEKDKNIKLDHSIIQLDSAVWLGEPEAQVGSTWYILEDRKEPLLDKDEINKDHTLFDKLIGKKAGDLIVIAELGPVPQQKAVKEIKHKYVHALHESMNNFNTWFPDAAGLWSIKVDTEKRADGGPPAGIQTIFDQVKKRDDYISQVEQFYKEGKLTLGAVAKLVGRDLLEAWGGMIMPGRVGLKSSEGSPQERETALIAIRTSPTLVMDPIAIMTIHGIGLADKIVTQFGKPIVASSTMDLLRENIAEKRGIGSEGYLSIAAEGDQFVKQEITKEEIEKNIKYLDSIVKWVNDNCDVLPCDPALKIDLQMRKQIEKLLGKESYETILLAAEPGRILYSDDERLRSIAQGSYNCSGIWTQLLLMEAVRLNGLSSQEYAQATLKLMNSNYHHTSISKEVLEEAAKQASWKVAEPLTSVLGHLREGKAELLSAAAVGTEFLETVWAQTDSDVSPKAKDKIAKYLMEVLEDSRSLDEILHQVREHLDRLFANDPTKKERIKSSIRTWIKSKGVDILFE